MCLVQSLALELLLMLIKRYKNFKYSLLVWSSLKDVIVFFFTLFQCCMIYFFHYLCICFCLGPLCIVVDGEGDQPDHNHFQIF